MIPKKPADIFSYICHFIFAIIITNSYDSAKQIFINPESGFLADTSSIIPSLELFLAYVAIISGWVGYSRSMIKWPHTNTRFGALRFSLDLAILFCYFGLISSVDLENGFRDHFLNWIIALFTLFMIWDVIKLKEHYRKENNYKFNIALGRSLTKTILFWLAFFVAVPVIFDSLLQNQIGIINDQVIYGSILILTISLLLLYRYWKWSIPPQKRSVTKDIDSKKKLPKS